MSVSELLRLVSEGLKKPITQSDIFSKEINISHLKRIDKIFKKGLHFYFDPKIIEASKDASIFFRKSEFGADLNIGARKIVNQFEDLKISLSAIAKLAELNSERTIPIYNIHQNPKEIAQQLRLILYPKFTIEKKEFLKDLIFKLADNNILVFEFVETWNKKDKANIDGFFLKPNVIVLKRQQRSFRREIFTLIHELGHFLINEEEIEELEVQNLANRNVSAIERWCNDFAYYFLAGEYDKIIEGMERANSANDYHFDLIRKFSDNTHLSQIALFTRLLFKEKISQHNYNTIKKDFDENYKIRLEEEKKKRELDKQKGKKQLGSTPKPIKSPLLVSTLQSAYYEGIINEYDFCKTLNIKPDKLESYIQ